MLPRHVDAVDESVPSQQGLKPLFSLDVRETDEVDESVPSQQGLKPDQLGSQMGTLLTSMSPFHHNKD